MAVHAKPRPASQPDCNSSGTATYSATATPTMAHPTRGPASTSANSGNSSRVIRPLPSNRPINKRKNPTSASRPKSTPSRHAKGPRRQSAVTTSSR